jgi:hypothetical protein
MLFLGLPVETMPLLQMTSFIAKWDIHFGDFEKNDAIWYSKGNPLEIMMIFPV